jgi:hypothetical protein
VQIDYNNNTYDLWTWTTNVSDGVSANAGNASRAASAWQQQVSARNTWNTNNPTKQIAMHPPITETPCVFTYVPLGGQHPFSDAIWIKMYNSGLASSTWFITFDPVSAANGGGGWVVQNTNNFAFDYVGRVCGATP